MWTNGTYTWFGPEACEAGFLLAPDSPAIDQGALIEGFHCPAPGPDPSGCVEWSGAAPDIGACEMIAAVTPPPPSDFPVVLNSTLGTAPEEKTVTVNIVKQGPTVTLNIQANDAEQCDEGNLYINGNGPVQLWQDSLFVPDATDPCYMSARNGVTAPAAIVTDAAWWNDGDNAVRFVHDKVTSSGFVVESMIVVTSSQAPNAPAAVNLK